MLFRSHELVRERIRAWMARHPEDCAELTENAVRLAYAERLEAVFDSLLHKDMTAALQAGSRALVYCVQAEAWDRLGSFASDLATGTQDPLLLRALLPHLSAAAAAAPAGRMRWVGLGTLASAVYNAGQPDASLPYYELAAAQARAAAEAGEADARQAWSDFAVIVSNWAAALLGVGQLDAARQRLVDSAEAARRAGRPEVNVVGSELEALRIDTMQGKAEKALPEVEQRLARMEGWWRRHRAGKQVAEAPDPEVLARAYISALDIAGQAHLALEDWDAALLRVEAVLEAEHVLNRPAEDIAATRMNRADLLAKLDRRAEARTEMEACLGIFQHSPANHSKVLSSLASLAAAEGDVAQAISLERRSLAQREKLPDPRDRAQSHGNLANHLDRRSTPTDRAEPARHMLAALVYFLVAGMRQYLQTSLRNYAVDFRRASGAGTEPDIPSVAELLADPAFDSVKTWLAQRQVDLGELQTAVDQFLAMARQKATEFSRKPTPPSP